MTRRQWIASVGALAGGACAWHGTSSTPASLRSPIVQTATGPVPVDRLGVTLMHEHVLVDFVGAAAVSRSRYDANEVFQAVLPHLMQARTLGCTTLVECTPAYLGRDPELLRRLSKASGVTILTNTGYYGAANDKHLPAHAFTETAEQLAARWIREHERGIDGTKVKPAFMKIGVDAAPLADVDARLVRAAALAHRETRLPIASHTTTGAAAMEQLDVLEGAGVPLSAFIWVHAQNERDHAFHVRAARRGAWVEFDGIAPASVERHVDLVRRMRDAGLLGQVLVSHDAGWYRVGEPGGGRFRAYDTLFTQFVPALTSTGFDSPDIDELLVGNPRRALTTSRGAPITPSATFRESR